MKFPELIDAAVASAAPIPSYFPSINKFSYYEYITNEFAEVDKYCPILIRKGL